MSFTYGAASAAALGGWGAADRALDLRTSTLPSAIYLTGAGLGAFR